MLHLNLTHTGQSAYTLLCLGAHSDDIEVGCGGTILKLLHGPQTFSVHWIVFSANGERRREALSSAKRFLARATHKTVHMKKFKMSFFPYLGSEIKSDFERLKGRVNPDLIFTHYSSDLHQDHRVISELTWNTFRDHLVFEYEIPKYDGDLGRPNCFVELDKDTCAEKIRYVMEEFRTQRSKQWFTDDTLWGILRLRGVEANAKTRYAEAFHCRKVVF